ncbi:hypothetical protein AB6A40_000907 [Gnathostoma spinigerum]|uniref:Uncharacterized protein n=1 Tax=Gnathostoma spinigerum TaxID=75299 RepID=A0ABD6E305_9BILA
MQYFILRHSRRSLVSGDDVKLLLRNNDAIISLIDEAWQNAPAVKRNRSSLRRSRGQDSASHRDRSAEVTNPSTKNEPKQRIRPSKLAQKLAQPSSETNIQIRDPEISGEVNPLGSVRSMTENSVTSESKVEADLQKITGYSSNDVKDTVENSAFSLNPSKSCCSRGSDSLDELCVDSLVKTVDGRSSHDYFSSSKWDGVENSFVLKKQFPKAPLKRSDKSRETGANNVLDGKTIVNVQSTKALHSSKRFKPVTLQRQSYLDAKEKPTCEEILDDSPLEVVYSSVKETVASVKGAQNQRVKSSDITAYLTCREKVNNTAHDISETSSVRDICGLRSSFTGTTVTPREGFNKDANDFCDLFGNLSPEVEMNDVSIAGLSSTAASSEFPVCSKKNIETKNRRSKSYGSGCSDDELDWEAIDAVTKEGLKSSEVAEMNNIEPKDPPDLKSISKGNVQQSTTNYFSAFHFESDEENDDDEMLCRLADSSAVSDTNAVTHAVEPFSFEAEDAPSVKVSSAKSTVKGLHDDLDDLDASIFDDDE